MPSFAHLRLGIGMHLGYLKNLVLALKGEEI